MSMKEVTAEEANEALLVFYRGAAMMFLNGIDKGEEDLAKLLVRADANGERRLKPSLTEACDLLREAALNDESTTMPRMWLVRANDFLSENGITAGDRLEKDLERAKVEIGKTKDAIKDAIASFSKLFDYAAQVDGLVEDLEQVAGELVVLHVWASGADGRGRPEESARLVKLRGRVLRVAEVLRGKDL